MSSDPFWITLGSWIGFASNASFWISAAAGLVVGAVAITIPNSLRTIRVTLHQIDSQLPTVTARLHDIYGTLGEIEGTLLDIKSKQDGMACLEKDKLEMILFGLDYEQIGRPLDNISNYLATIDATLRSAFPLWSSE